MKFKHEIEKVDIQNLQDFSLDIIENIKMREIKGWEHYDTVMSPSFEQGRSAYLFFKKLGPVTPKKVRNIAKELDNLRKSRMKIVD